MRARRARTVEIDAAYRPPAIRRLVERDAGRASGLLVRKYQRMAADPFAFFRGAGHIFHADFPTGFDEFPLVWLNGDLHLENFGTYRGDNRLTYFDLGDFDEGALGPASRDLMRFLSGLHLAMPLLGQPATVADRLARAYLAAYANALHEGKALWLDHRLASGLIGNLMTNLERRQSCSAWLRSRVEGQYHGPRRDSRRLRLDVGKFMPVPAEWRGAVERTVERLAKDQERAGQGSWHLLDIAWRVAGLGTLGLPRFGVLIRVAQGSAGRPITTEGDLLLLDLKQQPGSAMAPYLHLDQPDFASEADRIVAIENRLQAVSPALLRAVKISGQSFTLRELQPEADKLDLAKILASSGHLESADLAKAVETMGRLTAWAQLRSAGRQGSAIADQLIAFAGRKDWRPDLLRAGRAMAKQTEQLWRNSRDWLSTESGRLRDAAALATMPA
ncbi:DUF2252 family protein [Dongia soli]|uniref:DUF2252 family protein n=1 Tax=Dongia soli TaxID=600628 RepID=A0ABU5E868_9PROT|nr:DUF2252 family protein [Dongia soli]MDY0881934.1 DUF2252 family protein [Dongia soli]